MIGSPHAAAKAIAFMARELIAAREFRDARINHAVAEAAYSVPDRPVLPRTVEREARED